MVLQIFRYFLVLGLVGAVAAQEPAYSPFQHILLGQNIKASTDSVIYLDANGDTSLIAIYTGTSIIYKDYQSNAFRELVNVATGLLTINGAQDDIDIKLAGSAEDSILVMDAGTGTLGLKATPTANRLQITGNVGMRLGDRIYQGTGNDYWITTDSLYHVIYARGDTTLAVDTLGVVWLRETAVPGTRTGYGAIYMATDGRIYIKNDGGTVYDLTTSLSGGTAFADSLQTSGGKYDFDNFWTAAGLLDTLNLVEANWETYIGNHFVRPDTFWMSATWDTTFTGMDVSFGGVMKQAITVIEIEGWTNTSGSVPFNLKHRARTTPGSGGINVLSANLTADTDGQATTSGFNDNTIDKNRHLRVIVGTVTGDPDEFGVTVSFIVN